MQTRNIYTDAVIRSARADVARAAGWGVLIAALVLTGIYVGSLRLRDFDAALVFYVGASVLSAFGMHAFTFNLTSPIAPLVFNVLDLSAVLVIIGVALAMWRRGRDRGALAVQQFGDDLLPQVMLFAVSITGIFLTVSTHLMLRLHFVFLSQLHAFTVIFTLLYLSCGKFFHIFQRPAQLGVAFYREVGAHSAPARCARCDEPFASCMHLEDLKQVERELKTCRRKTLAILQDALWRRGA